MVSLIGLLDSLLVSHVDTTPAEAADHLMQLTASRYSALLALFRCQASLSATGRPCKRDSVADPDPPPLQCTGIVESAAMLMRVIVDSADVGTCRAMQVRGTA